MSKLVGAVMGSDPDTLLNQTVQSTEVEVSMSSLCIRILNEQYQTVGAMAFTRLGVRLATRVSLSRPLKTRGLLDFRVSNLQLLEVTEVRTEPSNSWCGDIQ
jgi:hypothetical protein